MSDEVKADSVDALRQWLGHREGEGRWRWPARHVAAQSARAQELLQVLHDNLAKAGVIVWLENDISRDVVRLGIRLDQFGAPNTQTMRTEAVVFLAVSTAGSAFTVQLLDEHSTPMKRAAFGWPLLWCGVDGTWRAMDKTMTADGALMEALLSAVRMCVTR